MPTPPDKVKRITSAYAELLAKVDAIDRRVVDLERRDSAMAEARMSSSQTQPDERSATYRELVSRLDQVERFMIEDPVLASYSGATTGRSSGLTNKTRGSREKGSVAGLPGVSRYAAAGVLSTASEKTVAGLPILNVAAHELGAQDMTYNFSETMWDVMPFCFLGVLTFTDQLCAMLVALLNVAVQGCFIGLVSTSMLHNDFADDGIVSTFEKWRVLYAHNPDFADAFTDEPLAQSLCAKSFFMMQGASQASLYNDMDDYTTPFLATPAGGVMCLLSVFLWILTCAKEFKRMSLFFVGIWTSNDQSYSLWGRPYKRSFVQILDNPVIWLYGEARQKNYQVFITPSRALSLTFLVFLPRAVILISLGLTGILWLVQTVQLSELILNAVALEVVMNVDELLFDLFSPASASRMVYKTMPLRVPRSKGLGHRVEPWFKLATITLGLTAVGWGLLAPMIKIINDVKVVMCEGEQRFLAVQLPFGPVVAAQPSATAVDRESYKYRAIYQKTGLAGPADNEQLLYLEGGVYQLAGQFQVAQIKSWRDQSIKDVAQLSAIDSHSIPCKDNAYSSSHPSAKVGMMSGVGSITGNQTMQSCGDVAHLCYNDTSLAGKAARLICPNTCGMSPNSGFPIPTDMGARSGLFLDTTEDGIPIACGHGFAISLYVIPCVDRSLGELLNGSEWKHYADGFSAYWTPIFRKMSTVNNTFNLSHFNFLRNFLWAGMSTYGCSFFTDVIFFPELPTGFRATNFCDPKEPPLQGKRSIRSLCPITCGCHSYVKPHYRDLIVKQQLFVVSESECPSACFN